jgi:PBP1b-binding outer membrane lipoprotein LpoB
MKKVIALSALLIAVAVGCSSQADTPSSTSTTFKKATTTTQSQSLLVNSFVGAMSEEFPGATRSEYISLGKTGYEHGHQPGLFDRGR